MEYINEEILDLGYKEKKKGTNFIKKHKAMFFIIICTILLIGINSFMINEFIKILSTL